jgi:MazG family protein
MAKRARTTPARARTTRARTPAQPGARARAAQASAGRAFQQLVDIMARLRGPRGCPWDREQTIESLRGFVLEETYEVLDAIDRADHDALRGEIGDLLFEGVFLAQMEADEGRFTVADSLRAITAKLIRRHPHVFGTTGSQVKTPTQVVEQWEQIKGREQKDAGERRSILRGVPKAMPSLLRAHEIGTRVAAVGFDWAEATDVVEKIEEEVAELRRAVKGEGRKRAEEEMGDLLFSMANLARKLGIEPESALREANEKFSERFEAMERAFEERGESVHDATLETMEREWGLVKSNETAAAVALHATTSVALHEPTAGTTLTKDTKHTKAPKRRSRLKRQSAGRRRPNAGERGKVGDAKTNRPRISSAGFCVSRVPPAALRAADRLRLHRVTGPRAEFRASATWR